MGAQAVPAESSQRPGQPAVWRQNYLTNITFSNFSLVTSSQLLKEINKLQPKRSAGFDDILNKLVKECKFEIMSPLLHIMNSSFESGLIRTKLKFCEVKPIFNKGNKNLKKNYRPISVLPYFLNIFKRLKYNKIITFLEGINYFEKNQHGCLRGKSTITAVINYGKKESV